MVVGLALFIAHVILGYNIMGVIAHAFVVALACSCAVAIKNALIGGVQTPPPRILIHPSMVRAAALAVGEACVAAIERVNVLLDWSQISESGRAAAYAWLAARLAPFCSPKTLVTLWVSAFILAPAYEQFGQPLDVAIANKFLPLISNLHVSFTLCIYNHNNASSNKYIYGHVYLFIRIIG